MTSLSRLSPFFGEISSLFRCRISPARLRAMFLPTRLSMRCETWTRKQAHRTVVHVLLQRMMNTAATVCLIDLSHCMTGPQPSIICPGAGGRGGRRRGRPPLARPRLLALLPGGPRGNSGADECGRYGRGSMWIGQLRMSCFKRLWDAVAIISLFGSLSYVYMSFGIVFLTARRFDGF